MVSSDIVKVGKWDSFSSHKKIVFTIQRRITLNHICKEVFLKVGEIFKILDRSRNFVEEKNGTVNQKRKLLS